jgi:hypothetical protein
MALNLVRGFRRVGWVLTLPVAALIVLVFYETTKQFSASEYQATHHIDLSAGIIGDTGEAKLKWEEEIAELREVKIPSLGTAYFLKEVPQETAEKIINDFEAKLKAGAPATLDLALAQGGKIISSPPPGFILDPPCWTFTVHKKINKLKLAGLIAGSVVISVLLIQGSISVLAWVFRGFKG